MSQAKLRKIHQEVKEKALAKIRKLRMQRIVFGNLIVKGL